MVCKKFCATNLTELTDFFGQIFKKSVNSVKFFRKYEKKNCESKLNRAECYWLKNKRQNSYCTKNK